MVKNLKKLELFFENEEGRTVKHSLDNPIEPVNPALVEAAMDEIIQQNIFFSPGGNLVKKKSARVVETIVEDIEISE